MSKYIIKDLLCKNLYFKEFEELQGRPAYTGKKENAAIFDTEIEAIAIKDRLANTEIMEVNNENKGYN